MAKDKKTIKVKAKINLKYDKDVVKIGQEFKIRTEDAQYMVEHNYIELIDELHGDEQPKEGE